MRSFLSPQTQSRRRLGFALIVILLVGALLLFKDHTPRSRLNVFQTLAAIFFAGVIYRAVSRFAPGTRAQPEVPEAGLGVAMAVAALAWASVIPCYFISDDFAIIRQAQSVTRESLWAYLMHTQATTFFRPVAQACLLLDSAVWHFSPAGCHVANLLLHLACVAGVYWLCRSFRFSNRVTSTCTLIFGVLPVEIEGVAWLSGRFDLLATGFTIWGAVLYARFRSSGRLAEYVGALALFLLGMLSKESGYVLPLFLLSAELFIYPTRKFKPWFGTVFMAGLVFLYRWHHLGGIGGYVTPEGRRTALSLNFKTLEGIFLRGPAQTLLGINWLQPQGAWFIAACSILAGILVTLPWSVRLGPSERGVIRFGICWMLLSMLPAHFLLLIGPGMTNARILYLPSVGAAIILGTLLSGVGTPSVRRVLTGVVVLLLGVTLVHNIRAWRYTSDLSRTFLNHLKELEPNPPRNADFVFLNMPETVRGVFLFHEGLTDAIKNLYGREDLSARREEAPSSNLLAAETVGGPSVRLEWTSDEAEPIRPVKSSK